MRASPHQRRAGSTTGCRREKILEYSYIPASPERWCERASRQHRNAERKGVNGNRYGIARTVDERAGGEVDASLEGYALRKVRAVRRVVGAKNSATLVPEGK